MGAAARGCTSVQCHLFDTNRQLLETTAHFTPQISPHFTTNFNLSPTKPLSYITIHLFAPVSFSVLTRPQRWLFLIIPGWGLFTVFAVHIQTVAFFQYPLTRCGDGRLQWVCHRPGLPARHYQNRPPDTDLLFPKLPGEDFLCCTSSPVRGKRPRAVKYYHIKPGIARIVRLDFPAGRRVCYFL